jgi:hypothetical protein
VFDWTIWNIPHFLYIWIFLWSWHVTVSSRWFQIYWFKCSVIISGSVQCLSLYTAPSGLWLPRRNVLWFILTYKWEDAYM